MDVGDVDDGQTHVPEGILNELKRTVEEQPARFTPEGLSPAAFAAKVSIEIQHVKEALQAVACACDAHDCDQRDGDSGGGIICSCTLNGRRCTEWCHSDATQSCTRRVRHGALS